MTHSPQNVRELLDTLCDLAEKQERVSVGDLADAFGSRSYGPFLIAPALIEISPIGGVPGLPTVLAAIIALFSVQIMLGKRHLWLPQFILKRSVSSERMQKAAIKLRPLAERLDRWFHGRWPKLVSAPFVRIAGGVCLLLACTVPVLELVPFASTLPMAAVIAFGMALLVRDGALMAGALALSIGAISGGTMLWLGRDN